MKTFQNIFCSSQLMVNTNNHIMRYPGLAVLTAVRIEYVCMCENINFHPKSQQQVLLNNSVNSLGIMTEKDSNENITKSILKDEWSIRPCSVYKDEYDDCTSFKARFHQYFIHGENTDCSQWKTDYKNCVRYRDSNGNDVEAGAAVIKSEEERRSKRFHGHYANTIWEKRKLPPADWSKPLPEWMEKRNENSYLQLKQLELEGKIVPQDEKSYCLLM